MAPSPQPVPITAAHLNVPVDEPVDLKVVVVLPKRVDQGLGHLEPAHVEEELQHGEDGDVEINVVLGVLLLRVEELAPHDGGEEEGVHGEADDLGVG